MTNQTKHKLNCRVSGNGYPVVFLHGFLESLSMWEKLNFKNNFKCIEIDFPGHGDSLTEENQEYTMLCLAKEVNILLVEMSIEAYHIVGHSMGGYVGLELMKLDSNCVKLILLNSNFWKDSTQKVKDRERVAKIVTKNKNLFLYESIPNLFGDPERFNVEVKELIQDAKQIESEVIAKYSLAISQRKDKQKLIESKSDSVLIIQGEFDTIVPIEMMKEKLVGMKGAFTVLLGCGHMSHVESPQKVKKAIEAFLN